MFPSRQNLDAGRRREGSMKRMLLVLSTLLLVSACADPTGPRPTGVRAPRLAVWATPQELFATFVSLGTSNSQGVTSAGINAAGQSAAWPAQLAARVGVDFSLPLVQDPGCSPPLFAPLATNLALIAGFA